MTETRGGGSLFLGRDMDAAESVVLSGGVASVFSHQSPDKSTGNEDAAAILSYPGAAAVLAVADGLGGEPGGEHASSRALEAFAEALEAGASLEKECRAAILDGFEHANQAVLELSAGATTLAVAAIEDGGLRTFHAGDSGILCVGQRGKMKLQTLPHSPVGYAVESGLLDAREAMHHEDRHIVANVVGSEEMRIDVGPPRLLAARDTVVLATDGLFDNLHLDEIVELVRKGPLDRVGARLAKAARQRMGEADERHPSKPDDLTFILYRGSGKPR